METPPTSQIPQLTEHLFRHETGKLISALTGVFGIHRLQLAEDVVQDAMIRALQTWPYYGVPANPAAWLMQTARNKALDVIRREKWFQDKLPEVTATLDDLTNAPAEGSHDDEIADNRLRLIFACCHPSIPLEDQTVLSLKTLCGFNIQEIASSYFTSEAAIAKRLTRAKQRIQEQQIAFEIPEGNDLSIRLEGVLRVIYLVFNEGYKASSGSCVVREDLCHEAIRLGTLLVSHPATDLPRTHALLAIMWMNAARLKTREGESGNVLRLQEQDRTRWDQAMLGQGLLHFSRAAAGTDLSEYHLQAGITACHCTAPDFTSTDWAQILAYYDRWLEMSASPVVALNRAVAVAEVHGPEAGLAAIQSLDGVASLAGYYLVDAVKGDLEERCGHFEKAASYFQSASEQTPLAAEKSFLKGRRDQCLRAVAALLE